MNHIISKCSKLAQKEYKTWHDWVGKVIHWELCKNFDYKNKWYIHHPESALENIIIIIIIYSFRIIKSDSVLFRFPELEPLHHILFSVTHGSPLFGWEGSFPSAVNPMLRRQDMQIFKKPATFRKM